MSLVVRAQLRFLWRARGSMLSALLGMTIGVASVVGVHLLSAQIAWRVAQQAQPVGNVDLYLQRAELTDADYFRLRARWRAGELPQVAAMFPLLEGQVSLGADSFLLVGTDPFALGVAGKSPSVSFSNESGEEDEGGGLSRLLNLLVSDSVNLPVSLSERSAYTLSQTITLSNHPVEVLGFSAPEGVILADLPTARAVLSTRRHGSKLSTPAAEDADRLSRIGVKLEPVDEAFGFARMFGDTVRQLFPGVLAAPVASTLDSLDADWLQVAAANQDPTQNLLRAVLFNIAALSVLALVVAWLLTYQVACHALGRRVGMFERLQSLGVARGRLRRLTQLEGCALGVAATLLGALVGLLLANLLLSIALGTDLQTHLELSTFAWLKAFVSGVGVAGFSYWLAADQALNSEASSELSAAKSAAKSERTTGRILLQRALNRWRVWLLLLFIALFVWGLLSTSLVAAFICIVVAALTLIVYLPRFAQWLWQRTLVPAARLRVPTLRTLGMRQVLLGRELRLGVSALALALATALGISIMVDSFRTAFVAMLEKRLVDDVVLQIEQGLGASSVADGGLAGSRFVLEERVAPIIDASFWRGSASVSTQGVSGIIEFSDNDRQLLARFVSLPDIDSALIFEKDHVFLNESFARLNGIDVGDNIQLQGEQTAQSVAIAGIFSDFGELRPRVLASQAFAARLNGRATLDAMYLQTSQLSKVQSTLKAWLDDSSVVLADQSQIRKRSIEVFEQTFAITRALTWLALLVAAVALANALAAHGLQQQGTAKQLNVLGLEAAAQKRLRRLQTAYVATTSVVLAVPLGLIIAALLCYAVNPRAYGWSFEMRLTAAGIGWPLLGGALGGVVAAALGDWLSRRQELAAGMLQRVRQAQTTLRTSLVPLFILLFLWLASGCADGGSSQVATRTTASTPALRVGSVLGGSGSDSHDGFDRATEVVQFNFPADHGTHLSYRSEWWYLTCPLYAGVKREGVSDGNVSVSEQTAERSEYGVQFTLFRQGLIPPTNTNAAGDSWRTGQIYMAHAALTDVDGQRHLEASRLARGHQRLAGVVAEPFAAWLENWRLEADTGQGLGSMRLHVDSGEFAIDLELTDQKAIVLQGNQGLSYKGSREASYYYSLPRLAASGYLQSFTEPQIAVAGACWLDREWSTSVLADNLVGWDWFALQFDDATELMLFQLREVEPSAAAPDHSERRQGKRIDRDGLGVSLPGGELRFKPLRHWQDETGTRWPVEWEVTTPDRRLRITAALDDQKMRSSIEYWEGLVWVFENDTRIGQGYLEMTGYGVGDSTGHKE